MSEEFITYIDDDRIAALVARAQQAPRGRLNLNLHPRLDDPIQRFINAGEPASYVRPHRHRPDRWEFVLTLRGQIDALIFDDGGRVLQRQALKPGGNGIIQLPGATWHSFVFAAPGTVAFELKPGPYDARTDKEFAAWAPEENAAGAVELAHWLATASVGARWVGARG